MVKIINLIKNIFKKEEIQEATPYVFEYDHPIEKR